MIFSIWADKVFKSQRPSNKNFNTKHEKNSFELLFMDVQEATKAL